MGRQQGSQKFKKFLKKIMNNYTEHSETIEAFINEYANTEKDKQAYQQLFKNNDSKDNIIVTSIFDVLKALISSIIILAVMRFFGISTEDIITILKIIREFIKW